MAARVPERPMVCDRCNFDKPVNASCHLSAVGSDEHSIQLEFNEPLSQMPVLGFLLYANGVLLYEGDVSQRSFSFIGCETGKLYEFQLTARSKPGDSMRSSSLARYCARRPYAPPAPKVLKSTASEIFLHWEPPADDGGRPVTGYVVQRANKTEFKQNRTSFEIVNCQFGAGVTVQTLPPDQRICEDRDVFTNGGCGPERTCQYRVIALNGVDDTNYADASDIAILKAVEVPQPPTPQNVSRLVPATYAARFFH